MDTIMEAMRKKLIILIFLLIISVIIPAAGYIFFGPVGGSNQSTIFVVPQKTGSFDVPKSLLAQKLIRNDSAFHFLLMTFAKNSEIKPGGYRLDPTMASWQILSKLIGKPDLFWVEISYCPRKEQIGEKLKGILGWDQGELDKWNNCEQVVPPNGP